MKSRSMCGVTAGATLAAPAGDAAAFWSIDPAGTAACEVSMASRAEQDAASFTGFCRSQSSSAWSMVDDQRILQSRRLATCGLAHRTDAQQTPFAQRALILSPAAGLDVAPHYL